MHNMLWIFLYLESKNNEIDLVFLVKNDGEFVKQKYLDSIKVTGNEFISKLNRKEDTGLTDKTNNNITGNNIQKQ